MTLDLFNTEQHEQMRCGFLHRDDHRIGFIGVESTLSPKLHGFYTFTDIEQVKELRMFLEQAEKEIEAKNESEANLTDHPGYEIIDTSQ